VQKCFPNLPAATIEYVALVLLLGWSEESLKGLFDPEVGPNLLGDLLSGLPEEMVQSVKDAYKAPVGRLGVGVRGKFGVEITVEVKTGE